MRASVVVLGPLLEEHFRRALILSRGDLSVFVERPDLTVDFTQYVRQWLPEQLDTFRKEAQAAGLPPAYDGRFRVDADEAVRRIEAGERAPIRFAPATLEADHLLCHHSNNLTSTLYIISAPFASADPSKNSISE